MRIPRFEHYTARCYSRTDPRRTLADVEHDHSAGSYGQPNSNRYQDNNVASYTSRDTQDHQYVSKGLHDGGHGYGGHANGNARAEYEDSDMADATPAQYQPYQAHHTSAAQARPVETSRHAHQQQSSTSSYGYGSHVVPQRQIPRPAETPQVVISPTPSQGSSVKSRRTSSRYSLADFTFIRTLGTGSFGRVHLVRSQHNSRSYAIKVLSKERVIKMKQVEHTNSEREMLERVRHPFLVNLWGTFKDSKNLYMVMDFVAGGELFSLLRKSQVRLSSLCSRPVPTRSPQLTGCARPPFPSVSRTPSQNSLRPKSRSRSTTSTRSTSSTAT